MSSPTHRFRRRCSFRLQRVVKPASQAALPRIEPSHQQLITENFASFFNKLLKGRVSDNIRSYLTDVRLCLIPKSDNPLQPTYRMIGVGETTFRLLGRTILAKVGKEIGKKIAPQQLAVGISGGVEIAASIAGMLEAIKDSQPAAPTYCKASAVMVRLSICDGATALSSAKHPPELFKGTPCPPSTLHWECSPSFSSYKLSFGAFRRTATSYKTLNLVFSSLLPMTSPIWEEPKPSSNIFGAARPFCALPLNQSKTWIMGPQVPLQDGETTLPCRTMRDRGKTLGTPFGNIHFILSWLHDHFRDNGPPLQILGQLPARAAITLLKISYNSRMDYPRKTSSEAIVNTGIFAEYDALIDSAILTTGIADCRDRIHELRALPLSKGGLGHHGRRHHLVTAMRAREFLKLSYSQFLHAHTTTFNPKDVDIDGTHPEEITEALYELREKHPTEDALHIFATALRKRNTEADIDAAANFHQYLLANEEEAAAAVFLSTQGVKQSFLLFSTSLHLHSDTQLTNKEYIEAARFLLLSPFKMNADGFFTCRCRRENPWNLLTHPFHTANCPFNSSERTFRHSAIVSLLCKLLRKASPTSRMSSEPRNSTAAIYPDIAVEENTLLFHAEVYVVEPTSMRATTKGTAARLKEAAKLAKYHGTEWANVIPFVLESTGHLGKEAEALLEKTTADKRTLRTWFLEELLLILARSQGKMRIKAHALLR